MQGALWRRGYAILTAALHPFFPFHLKRRCAQGKEDPKRWREKLAFPSMKRSQGQLVWLHAVGLGETLALRGAIIALQERLPDAQFLVTSSTRASAEVFAQNAPPGIVHQYLPLDTPKNVRAFMDHWQPNLSIWTEQELWPGFIFEAARRSVPLALINARVTEKSFIRRKRTTSLYQTLFAEFALISAQDGSTVKHLQALGALNATLSGSMKSIAPPLRCDHNHLSALQSALKGRFVWIAASTHKQDEEIVFAAHAQLLEYDPDAFLVVIPRSPERAQDALTIGLNAGVNISKVQTEMNQAWVVDRFGELGLWYRLSEVAFVGGTNSAVEGHNPWEAAALSCPILHGPCYQNFKADFPTLQQAGGAQIVCGAEQLSLALQQDVNWPQRGTAALNCVERQKSTNTHLFDELAELCS